MIAENIVETSEDLASKLAAVLLAPKYDESIRIRVSHLACSVSLEHFHAVRTLLLAGLVPSGLVVLRAQYEAIVRAVWAMYAAPDNQLEKLGANLAVDTEQAAKNLPQVGEMMTALAEKAPNAPYQALSNFKETSWQALNSYVHAGIHPLQRHESGHAVQFVEQIMKNSNGVAVIAGMQAAVLTGSQALVRQVGALQISHAVCLPST